MPYASILTIGGVESVELGVTPLLGQPSKRNDVPKIVRHWSKIAKTKQLIDTVISCNNLLSKDYKRHEVRCPVKTRLSANSLIDNIFSIC